MNKDKCKCEDCLHEIDIKNKIQSLIVNPKACSTEEMNYWVDHFYQIHKKEEDKKKKQIEQMQIQIQKEEERIEKLEKEKEILMKKHIKK